MICTDGPSAKNGKPIVKINKPNQEVFRRPYLWFSFANSWPASAASVPQLPPSNPNPNDTNSPVNEIPGGYPDVFEGFDGNGSKPNLYVYIVKFNY